MPQILQLNAVNLMSSDIGENDRLLKLFSYEKGLVTARIKGVKKALAKLKFAGEPFCFGKYSLHKGSGGYYTVTGCEAKELFYDLRLSLENFTAASAMAEYCLAANYDSPPERELFKLLLNCLNALCYGKIAAENVLIYFFINALKINGSVADFVNCRACGAKLSLSAAMDTAWGGFICSGCNINNIRHVSPAVYKTIMFISIEEDVARLNTIRTDKITAAKAIECINIFVHSALGKKINSVQKFVSLINNSDQKMNKKT